MVKHSDLTKCIQGVEAFTKRQCTDFQHQTGQILGKKEANIVKIADLKALNASCCESYGCGLYGAELGVEVMSFIKHCFCCLVVS